MAKSTQIAKALRRTFPELPTATCRLLAAMFAKAVEKTTVDNKATVKDVRIVVERPRPPLGDFLQQYRRAAGYTQRTAADAVEWSVDKLVRIESGRVGISITDLGSLLRLYNVTDPDRVAQLQELARKGQRK